MKLRTALIALASLILVNIQPSFAQPQPQPQPQQQTQLSKKQMMPSHKMDWKEKLGLTDKQIDKIKQIKDSSYDDMKAMRLQKWDLYKQMILMSHEKTIDQQKLNTLLSNMNTLSEKMMRQEIQIKHDIYMVLTPEQQVKMKEMLQQRLKSMEKVYAK